MKKISLLIACLWVIGAVAQIPARPSPPRLVNDLAGLFTAEQCSTLERTLVAFNDSTSNQILVLTVNDLNGQDASSFAYTVGEEWGVGQQKFNNGIVILIKPKIGNSYGDVFIATGYGLEGALPDATCKLIVEREMIPHFRENDYYGGVVAAIAVIMPLARGEYSSSEYAGKNKNKGYILPLLVVIALVLVAVFSGSKNNNSSNMGSGGTRTIPWWMMGGGSSGGSFGGGGFGGFGGGSFGGGGAGGRW